MCSGSAKVQLLLLTISSTLGLEPWTQRSKDFLARKALAWEAALKLSKIWKSLMSRNLKLRFIKATVETVLLYGAVSLAPCYRESAHALPCNRAASNNIYCTILLQTSNLMTPYNYKAQCLREATCICLCAMGHLLCSCQNTP